MKYPYRRKCRGGNSKTTKMGMPKKYKGPVTGKIYDLEHGDRIDPEKENIGAAGVGNHPSVTVGGKKKYSRIFIRLKTPAETLTCTPIRDGADFAQRASIIENWFNSVMRKPNMILTFEAVEITEQEAREMGLEQ